MRWRISFLLTCQMDGLVQVGHMIAFMQWQTSCCLLMQYSRRPTWHGPQQKHTDSIKCKTIAQDNGQDILELNYKHWHRNLMHVKYGRSERIKHINERHSPIHHKRDLNALRVINLVEILCCVPVYQFGESKMLGRHLNNGYFKSMNRRFYYII